MQHNWLGYNDKTVREYFGSRVSVAFNRAVCYDVFSNLRDVALDEEWGERELFVCSSEHLVLRNFGFLHCPITIAIPQNKQAKKHKAILVRWQFATHTIVYQIGRTVDALGSTRPVVKLVSGDLTKISDSVKKISKTVVKLQQMREAGNC